MSSIDCDLPEQIDKDDFQILSEEIEEYDPILISKSDWVDNFDLEDLDENEFLDLYDDSEYFNDEDEDPILINEEDN